MKISDLVTNAVAKRDPLTKAIIKHYNNCTLTPEKTWDDDSPSMYELPEDAPLLMILGDDNWGAVVGIYAVKGHLVLVAHYGDEGPTGWSPTLKRGEYINPLNDMQEWIASVAAEDVVAATPLLSR